MPRRTAAARFLRTFGLTVAVAGLVVAAVNLVAFRYMQRDDNQSIVQLLSGWGRVYKPVLYDEFEPQVAVFGASWARDAFDPIEIGRMLGKKVFNFAVSGATAYETRRFADSALQNPKLEAAVINLDTIYGAEDARTKYGFDESILDVGPDLKPNRWAWLSRVYSLVFTGWAIGTNIELLRAVHARDGGADESTYLPSYQRADMSTRRAQLAAAKARLFPKQSHAQDPPPRKPLTPFQRGTLAELDLMIDRFCSDGVDVYAYFTPRHMWEDNCDAGAGLALETLEFLRRKQATCPAKIGYFDFAYPNPVTLEGVLSPVSKSTYYRPDGHPRPTVGALMAARMFGADFPAGAPQSVRDDFGANLMTAPHPKKWLREHAARCNGVWSQTAAAP